MKLWLDDERDPSTWLPGMPWMRERPAADFLDWAWARTAQAAIELLAGNLITEASLDHDLGEEVEVGTGYDVVAWIEERTALDPNYSPPWPIHVHTSNLGARDRMESAVASIARLLKRREESSR